ncbi:hypothetical protein GCM10007913_12150 [Devosia yakushimensis]|uniref:Uncharacterized protein n=1 Tax=Devosia yakushimensis TaxID=470028 RepID=A0ABQ5UCC7_9HYPH|nr:hypothetical protein [Devosia yakushimensis]GLQ09283.1 hypothetical protein GCM10007913_12150 [Devosia yakushimensis]
MTREPSEEEFLKHVERHQLTVALDNGLYRHLTLKEPKSSNRHFHITTWPGYLTISGDMGCYVFARTPDMFGFFRDDNHCRINPSYWGEKLQAIGRSESYREFSKAAYRSALVRDFRDYYPQGTPDRMRIWKDVRWTLLDDFSPSTAEEAIRAVDSYRDPNRESKFREFWDHRLTDYTYHYIWCCRAIVWAIKQYDDRQALIGAGLTTAEKAAQASRCGCKGSDDLCPCQNAPDAQTIAERLAGAA